MKYAPCLSDSKFVLGIQNQIEIISFDSLIEILNISMGMNIKVFYKKLKRKISPNGQTMPWVMYVFEVICASEFDKAWSK